jgi:hypothetical protein
MPIHSAIVVTVVLLMFASFMTALVYASWTSGGPAAGHKFGPKKK